MPRDLSSNSNSRCSRIRISRDPQSTSLRCSSNPVDINRDSHRCLEPAEMGDSPIVSGLIQSTLVTY